MAQFSPVGAHSDGVDISSAVELERPAGLAANAAKLLIQALGQNVRFTLDGTTPTATLGFQLAAGDPPLVLHVGAAMTVTVIEETATADLQYQWGN